MRPVDLLGYVLGGAHAVGQRLAAVGLRVHVDGHLTNQTGEPVTWAAAVELLNAEQLESESPPDDIIDVEWTK